MTPAEKQECALLTEPVFGRTDDPSAEIARSIERMKSFYDSDRGFSDIVSYGMRSVPSLRLLLLSREPSGLHQARCRAADALAALKAYGPLEELLRRSRIAVDPVERLGDDAVISCAARGLARSRSDAAFKLLLDVAQHRVLSGVIAGLGSFRRKEAIPHLIAALGEDEVRITAEAALRQIGSAARPGLISAAISREPGATIDSESILRKRRSALRLLLDIGVSRKEWTKLRDLMLDHNAQIATLACGLALQTDKKSGSFAKSRLRELRRNANWLQRLEIDQYLQR